MSQSQTHSAFAPQDLSVVKEERFVFKCEWFDQMADLVRHYLFTYYPKDETAEMYDLKNKRMFIKRMACPGVTLRELFVGSIITIHSRQLKLTDYADVFTRKRFENKSERTFALIKPDCYTQTGKIIDALYENGFTISKLKMSKFQGANCDLFYEEHKGKPFFSDLSAFMSSDVVTGIELVGDNAVTRMRELQGPTDSAEAKKSAPHSLRAQFGTDKTRNAVHASADGAAFNREANIFFSK